MPRPLAPVVFERGRWTYAEPPPHDFFGREAADRAELARIVAWFRDMGWVR